MKQNKNQVSTAHLTMTVREQLVLKQCCQHPEGTLLILQAHHNQHKGSNVGQTTEVTCTINSPTNACGERLLLLCMYVS